jgi:hypothetical protein
MPAWCGNLARKFIFLSRKGAIIALSALGSAI